MQFDRDNAIETVMNEIWLNGYENASVKSISEKLGITRSSFYNSFESREALFKIALERYLSQIPEGRLLTATEDMPLKPLLTDVVRAACKRLAQDPQKRGCLAANCLAELLPVENAAGAFVASIANATLDQLDRLVTWAVNREELPTNTDIRGKALAIHSLMMGVNLQSKFVHSERDLWRSASQSLEGLGLLDSAFEDRNTLA